MNDLTSWLAPGLAAVAVVAVLLGLRVATVRKQRAALDAARQLAEQREQQAAHHQALALAQAQAEAQRLEAQAVAEARQRAQAVLLAQRQAEAAEREARRRAADEAARLHAQDLLDKRLAERAGEAAARAAAAVPTARVAPRPTVQVHVPARPALRAASAVPPPRTRAETVVLVADDSKVVRVKLGRLLAQHGFQVMLAEDGLAALRQMQLQVPHVLLTDAEMPGLDGLQLTRKVRSLPHMAHVPVLMISSADGSLGDAARAAGVTALLGKPYDEDQLLAHLDRVRRPATSAV
jgi:CheY-like chemotaxis protein